MNRPHDVLRTFTDLELALGTSRWSNESRRDYLVRVAREAKSDKKTMRAIRGTGAQWVQATIEADIRDQPVPEPDGGFAGELFVRAERIADIAERQLEAEHRIKRTPLTSAMASLERVPSSGLRDRQYEIATIVVRALHEHGLCSSGRAAASDMAAEAGLARSEAKRLWDNLCELRLAQDEIHHETGTFVSLDPGSVRKTREDA